jgi:hypothetical protein
LDHGDRRIEVGAAHRPQQRDQGRKNRNGCARIGNERDGKIPGGKPLGHDPGADHRCREQQ